MGGSWEVKLLINKLNRKVYNTNQKKMQYIKSSFGGIIIKLCILNIQLQKYLTFQITTITTTTTVTTTTTTRSGQLDMTAIYKLTAKQNTEQEQSQQHRMEI